MSSSGLAAVSLVVLAVMHSYLGERKILIPLLSQPWTAMLPRSAADRIVRFAWHLTSLAWLGLAGVIVGADPGVAVGAVCLVSAAVIVGTLRSHPAWPVFGVGGFAALDAAGALPRWLLTLGGGMATIGFVLAAGLHVYWMAGGRWLFDRAVPTRPAAPAAALDAPAKPRPMRRPGAIATAMVAIALLVMAAAVGSATVGRGATIWHLVGWAGVLILALRAIGDGRYVGLTKSVRSTPFARVDDRAFTPFIVLLALGAAGGLLSVA